MGPVPRGRGVLIALAAEPEPPANIGVGQKQYLGPSPVLAVLLAIAVGAAVFALIWKLRKTFGMKE